jgi:hypothetical protein
VKRFFAFLLINAFVFSGIYAMQVASSTEQNSIKDEIALAPSCQKQIDPATEARAPVAQDQYLPEGKDLLNAYSCPGRINVNGSWDLFITASYLYYQPMELGYSSALRTAVITDGNDEDHLDANTPSKEFSFDYHSAFKVGMGKHFAYDNWTSMIEYFRLHCSDTNHFYALTDAYLNPLWYNNVFQTPNVFTQAKTKVGVKFDLIDWSLGRTHYWGTKLLATPYVSLRGGWIKQSLSMYYTRDEAPLYVGKVKGKSHSWVVGPRCGLDGNWQLGAGFKFIGNVAGALLYQSFHTSLKYYSTVLQGVTPVVHEWDKDNKTQITPEIFFSLGLGYGTYFDNHNWHVDLSAAYNFDCFFNQNQISHVNTFIQNSGLEEKAHNLLLQGLEIKLNFDF